jgi:hypothetical protein
LADLRYVLEAVGIRKRAGSIWMSIREGHGPTTVPSDGFDDAVVLDPATYQRLLKFLDAPHEPNKKLRRLLASRAPWET